MPLQLQFLLDENKNAVACTLEEFLAWLKKAGDKPIRVALDHIVEGKVDVVISTVFLGINHAYSDGPPMIFETMIFGGKHDEYQMRYSTWTEAEKGHKKAVTMVRRELMRRVK